VSKGGASGLASIVDARHRGNPAASRPCSPAC